MQLLKTIESEKQFINKLREQQKRLDVLHHKKRQNKTRSPSNKGTTNKSKKNPKNVKYTIDGILLKANRSKQTDTPKKIDKNKDKDKDKSPDNNKDISKNTNTNKKQIAKTQNTDENNESKKVNPLIKTIIIKEPLISPQSCSQKTEEVVSLEKETPLPEKIQVEINKNIDNDIDIDIDIDIDSNNNSNDNAANETTNDAEEVLIQPSMSKKLKYKKILKLFKNKKIFKNPKKISRRYTYLFYDIIFGDNQICIVR